MKKSANKSLRYAQRLLKHAQPALLKLAFMLLVIVSAMAGFTLAKQGTVLPEPTPAETKVAVSVAPTTTPTPSVTPTPTPTPTPKPSLAPAPAKKQTVIVHTAPHSSVSGLAPTTIPSAPTPSPSSSPSSSPSNSGGSSGTGTSTQAAPVSYASYNWAGYLAASGSYSSVSGTWSVPNPTGNGRTTTADAAWVGIGGVTTNDLIQAGTFDQVSASGQVTVWAFYEMLPASATFIETMTINPGDIMSTTVSESSPNVWLFSLSDLTNGQTFSKSVSYASSHSSAEWIEEDPSTSQGQLMTLDNFGSISFSSGTTTVGGSTVNIAGSNASPITLVSRSGRPLATPSGVIGGSFSVSQ